MFSEMGFNIYVIGTYLWFLVGIVLVGTFGIRDAYRMIFKNRKENK
jgi:hypothetical protein